MNESAALARIRIVLVRTSHPGNIGAAARAMKTMGLERLYLVAPRAFPDPVAHARASGADDVLARACVVGSLDEALSGTVLSAALTARRREWSVPVRFAREAAAELVAVAARGDVALVFGTETSGLTNDEVALCTMPVSIPANPAFSSLNLGAAVQLLCYELRMAALVPQPPVQALPDAATFDEIEGFHRHLERAMITSGFYDPGNPKRLLPRVRRLFGRIRLEREEINILRGILSALERKPD
jgi:tRNA/rRNA methyltransferase